MLPDDLNASNMLAGLQLGLASRRVNATLVKIDDARLCTLIIEHGEISGAPRLAEGPYRGKQFIALHESHLKEAQVDMFEDSIAVL